MMGRDWFESERLKVLEGGATDRYFPGLGWLSAVKPLAEPPPPRGPHRIEECVIPESELAELLDWWDEFVDLGGEG